jgi:hypothetical protein
LVSKLNPHDIGKEALASFFIIVEGLHLNYHRSETPQCRISD